MKRFKNIEGKDKEQLKAVKDQREKQLQILIKKTDKVAEFKNVSFKVKLDSESKKAYNAIKERSEKINHIILVCIASGKHRYNFIIFLDIKAFG